MVRLQPMYAPSRGPLTPDTTYVSRPHPPPGVSRMPRNACAVASLLIASLWTSSAAAELPSWFVGRLVQQRTGEPVSGASVAVVGMMGNARTDEDGRFTWAPVPQVPFQVVVVLPGGQVAPPVLVETLHAGTTTIQVRDHTAEAVTVLGAAPGIDSAPAAATTVLSATQIARRNPEHLMQALETVPGINQVSEGHAAVPAVRGLARGRTLLLIDGGRVAAERRVGPSATFLDPSVVEASTSHAGQAPSRTDPTPSVESSRSVRGASSPAAR
jgi:TonB-dependent Receptor Plug Domain/Carboxypeptidase regulatory-like domain